MKAIWLRPAPRRLAIGRGQALFLAGILRAGGRRVCSGAFRVEGIPRRFPVVLAGRHHYGRNGDVCLEPGDVAFHGWIEIPAGFASPAVDIQLELRLGGSEAVRLSAGPAIVESMATALRVGGEAATPPRIAIAMATYEPPLDLFAAQIESIRRQSHPNWICLLSDDGSTEPTLAEMRRILGDDRRFALNAHGCRLGFYRNFERALADVPADADFVALADQDDAWFPDKLEALLGAFAAPEIQLAYSDMRVVDRGGGVRSETFWTSRRNGWTNLGSICLTNTVTGAAALFRRSLLDDALPFPQAIGPNAYHDHWIAMTALAAGRIAFVPRPLYDYVQHGRNALGHVDSSANESRSTIRGILDPARVRSRFDSWRRLYFDDAMRVATNARILLRRFECRLTTPKRETLRRLAEIDSPETLVYLLGRSLTRWRRSSDTVAFERGVLLPAGLWSQLEMRWGLLGRIADWLGCPSNAADGGDASQPRRAA